MMKSLLSHPLFSGSAILIVGSLFTNAINYVYHVILGRALGPENYGILASLYSILYLISIIPQSTSLSIVKFISSAKNIDEQRAIYQTVQKLIIKISLIGSFIIFICSPIIANFLHIDLVINIILIAPIFTFNLLCLVNQSTSQGRLKFMGMVLPNTLVSVTKLVLGIILVYLGFSVMGAMLGIVFGVIFAFFVSRPYVTDLLRKPKSTFKLKTFFKFSGPVLIQAIAFTSLMSTDLLLVKHFFSEFDAGIYAAISTLGKIIYFAAQPITGAMFPMISKRVSQGQKFLKIFLLSLLATLVMAIGVLGFYALFPHLAIVVLYGERYAKASGILIWVGVFYTLYTVAYFLTNFFLSKGKTVVAYLSVVFSILQIILIVMHHETLLEVVQISISLMVILCIMLFVYFYFDKKGSYEK